MFFTKRKSRRQIQNLKNLSKKSVDVGKFVKDFYVEKGLAYISCNVGGYNDIIDRYSVKGYEWLDESFARFIEENAIYIPPEYPIVLEICGVPFTDSPLFTLNITFMTIRSSSSRRACLIVSSGASTFVP